MDRLIAEAWHGEEELLLPHVRRNSALLLDLLAPDFYEIGQSGVRWGREDVVLALVNETATTSKATLSEREARVVGEHSVLLSYRLQFGVRQSLRSSLWQHHGDSIKCVFHQGTPVPRL